MSAGSGLPGRLTVAGFVGALLAAFVLADTAAHPIDPFTTPAPSALGSGVAPTGGHCAGPG